jgi:hypothetical protein
MPDDARFIARAYQPGDEAAILELFAQSFHRQQSPEHFRWKYLQNPYGNQHISMALAADGSLVGHYAGYPVSYVDRQREMIAHQIADLMTDRSIRHIGRGRTSVFGRTALHFYATFCEGKVAFNYGFNTATSKAFAIRFLNADCVEPVAYWQRDTALPRIARRQRWPRGFQLQVVTEIGEEYDRLFARAAPAYRFLVKRDARYLRWRYLQCPEPGYFMVAIRKWRRLVGWSVFRLGDHRLTWGDALFDPRHADAVEVLLRHVAPNYPVDRIEAWFPPRPRWFIDAVARLGLTPAREPQNLSLMCVPFTLPDATARMREALYYTMGDSDLF